MPRRDAVSLAVCLAAAFTTLLDQSSLNTALPALRTSLGAGPSVLQWIVAGYSLTFGLVLVPAGRLGDKIGRKWLFAGGVALFGAAGVVGGTATHPGVVAAARLVQGVGAGTVNPQVYGIIQELFTGRDRARALGAYSTVGGIAGVIGPLVGGSLIGAAGDQLGWRLVLLLNLPFALLTVPAAVLLLPGTRHSHARRTTLDLPTLDLPGLALIAVATLGLLLPFVGSGRRWLLVTAVAVVTLILWESRYARTGRTPILMPALLRSRGFTLGTLTAMFQFGASLSATLVLTLFLQENLGWPPLRAALTTLPSSLGFAVASLLSWRVVGRYGRRSVVWALIGSLCSLAVTVLVILVVPESGLLVALSVTQLFAGIANGLIISPNQALTLAHAPAGAAGLAGAFLQVSQRISATVATAAVTGTVLAGSGLAGSVLAGSGLAGSGRTAAATALVVCLVMLVASAGFAALDVRTPAVTSASAALSVRAADADVTARVTGSAADPRR